MASKVYSAFIAVLFLGTTSSNLVYISVNNETLLLKTFLRDNCDRQSVFDYVWCNESIPIFFCDRQYKYNYGDVEEQSCIRWCIGVGRVCSEVEECCGNEFQCINQICRSANQHIDFVVVAKVALAMALLVTVFAVAIICCRGLFHSGCLNFSSRYNDDDESSLSERRNTNGVPSSVQSEKPPPYEECVPEVWASHRDPPPYSVAVNLSQNETLNPPTRYYMAYDSELSELNVKSIRLQEVPLHNESIVSSTMTDMNYFVCIQSGSGTFASNENEPSATKLLEPTTER